ncbi:MAG: hypothetical protein ACI4LH_04340 [Candidatus Heritagella sp.]
MLLAVFLNGWEETLISYPVYVFSFYTVVVLTLFLQKTLPAFYKSTKQKVYGHPFGNQYMTDAAFKVRVSLYISLAINLGYSVFKLATGLLSASVWIGSIAIYYILLSVIRFLLLRYLNSRKDAPDLPAEHRCCRLCGILMILINLALSGIILFMVLKPETPVYSNIYVITSATYTFYTVTVSIMDLVRYRKYQSPVLSAAKAIRFAAALVSLLSLETTMLLQFGNDELFRRRMTALTGAGVCLIVLGMSIFMIVKAGRALRAEKEGSTREG